MQLIFMHQDWDKTDDGHTRHVLTAGNQFPVTDEEAERAVEGGFAEYVGKAPASSKAEATVEGVNTTKPTAAATTKDTATVATKPGAPSKGLAGGVSGEPDKNTDTGKTAKPATDEDAPA